MLRDRATTAGTLPLYVALVLWLTWPLAPHIRTHLPNTHVGCRFDTLYVAWTLSYQVHALATAPGRFADANIYYPTRRALFYGDGGFGALPYFAPTFLLTGNPALALNLVFLLGVALTAWTLHLSVRRWTASDLGGFLAAWTFLTTSWTLWEFVPTAPIYAVLPYFPLIILLTAEATVSIRRTLLLGLLVALQSLSSIVYVGGALFAPLTLVAGGRLLRRSTRRAGMHLFAAQALALLLLLPFAAGYLAVRAGNLELPLHTVWYFTVPTNLPWGLLGGVAPTAVAFGCLALIAVGAVSALFRGPQDGPRPSRQAWKHATFWALTGTLISITPTADLWGRTIVLPQAVFTKWLPLYQVGFFREPRRLGIAALMGLALLAGLAFAECKRRIDSSSCPRRFNRLLPVLLAGALVLEMYGEYVHGGTDPRWRRPKPSVYPLTEAISGRSPLIGILRKPGGPLLELPVEWGTPRLWPPAHARAMYRSIFHWRPLVNGYSGYWPSAFPARMTLAQRLPERRALQALREEAHLEIILVHMRQLGQAKRTAWLRVAAGSQPLLRLVARDGDDLLFRVIGTP